MEKFSSGMERPSFEEINGTRTSSSRRGDSEIMKRQADVYRLLWILFDLASVVTCWQKHTTPLCRWCRGWAGQQREYDKECKQATDGKQSGQLHRAVKIAGCAAREKEMRWFIQTNDTSLTSCLLLEWRICHARFPASMRGKELVHECNTWTAQRKLLMNNVEWFQIHVVVPRSRPQAFRSFCGAPLWLPPKGISTALKFYFPMPKSLFMRDC